MLGYLALAAEQITFVHKNL